MKREELVLGIWTEASAVIRYSHKALEWAEAGNFGAAINCLDTTKVACECMMKYHDQLWELAGEDIKENEFEAFCKAEELQNKRLQTVNKIIKAMERMGA